MVVGDVTTAVNTLIVGGGPAGYVAAIRAKQLGLNVTLVNAGPLGGTCLNSGCIPLKSLVSAARRYRQLTDESNAAMGLQVSGEVRFDWAALQSWKKSVVEKLSSGVSRILASHKIEVINGLGWFINSKELRVEGEYGSHRFAFEKCLLATGALPNALPGLPFGKNVLTPQQALELPQLPPALTIIGNDYIALEMATLFQSFGVKVTLLTPNAQILPEADPTAVRLMQASLRKMGAQIVTEASNFELNETENSLYYQASGKRGQSSLPVIAWSGMQPNLGKLNFSALGLKSEVLSLTPSMHTQIPNILAAGDCTAQLAMASVAIKQAKVAAESLAGHKVAYAPQVVPVVVHTTPEIAYVGWSAQAAKDAGYEVISGRFPLGANGRAVTLGSEVGVALIVAEKTTGVLLGMTLVGPNAGDLIMQAALGIEMGATLTDLSEILYPHPGLAELALESVENALGLTIHAI